jgi:6-phosphofructokinase 1
LLGHVQRGGSPTPFDRVLATRFGWHAAELVQTGEFGRMVALQGDRVTSVGLELVAGWNRPKSADSGRFRPVMGCWRRRAGWGCP